MNKRNYPKNLPDPITECEEFNQYLRDNNKVVREGEYWILIENSYIPNQHVAFCKLPVRDFDDYMLHALESQVYSDKEDLLFEPIMLFAANNNEHIYINATKDRSVPDRLHIHIKLDAESETPVIKIRSKHIIFDEVYVESGEFYTVKDQKEVVLATIKFGPITTIKRLLRNFINFLKKNN